VHEAFMLRLGDAVLELDGVPADLAEQLEGEVRAQHLRVVLLVVGKSVPYLLYAEFYLDGGAAFLVDPVSAVLFFVGVGGIVNEQYPAEAAQFDLVDEREPLVDFRLVVEIYLFFFPQLFYLDVADFHAIFLSAYRNVIFLYSGNHYTVSASLRQGKSAAEIWLDVSGNGGYN